MDNSIFTFARPSIIESSVTRTGCIGNQLSIFNIITEVEFFCRITSITIVVNSGNIDCSVVGTRVVTRDKNVKNCITTRGVIMNSKQVTIIVQMTPTIGEGINVINIAIVNKLNSM